MSATQQIQDQTSYMTLHLKTKTKLYQVWVMHCMGQGESPEVGPLSTEPLLSREGKEPVEKSQVPVVSVPCGLQVLTLPLWS